MEKLKMEKLKKERLEAKGWVAITAAELLGLTNEDEQQIEERLQKESQQISPLPSVPVLFKRRPAKRKLRAHRAIL